MDRSNQFRRLVTICEFVFADLGMRGIQNSCIQGSALLLKVLHGAGYREAFPLVVGVTIVNDEFLEFSKTNQPAFDEEGMRRFEKAGCLMMNIGYGGRTIAGEVGWDGHLVVIVPRTSSNRHTMVDLTIVQLDRPELGAAISPMILGVGDPFVTGAAPAQFRHNGMHMVYEARPGDRSYRDDGDLLAIEGLEQATANAIRNLRRCGLL